jgi:hypothetical protein
VLGTRFRGATSNFDGKERGTQYFMQILGDGPPAAHLQLEQVLYLKIEIVSGSVANRYIHCVL